MKSLKRQRLFFCVVTTGGPSSLENVVTAREFIISARDKNLQCKEITEVMGNTEYPCVVVAVDNPNEVKDIYKLIKNNNITDVWYRGANNSFWEMVGGKPPRFVGILEEVEKNEINLELQYFKDEYTNTFWAIKEEEEYGQVTNISEKEA